MPLAQTPQFCDGPSHFGRPADCFILTQVYTGYTCFALLRCFSRRLLLTCLACRAFILGAGEPFALGKQVEMEGIYVLQIHGQIPLEFAIVDYL